MPPVQDAAVAARLLWRLPRFLRRPISSELARATLADRVEHRADNFLALAQSAIYTNPISPYRRLLQIAGCELGDLRRLVQQDGIEGALAALYRRGVYLTVDELKGRRPAVRGSEQVVVQPSALRVSNATAHVPMSSSGSRGASVPAAVDLAQVWEEALDMRLALDARGGAGWTHAIWLVPGGVAIARLLEYTRAGTRVARWFSQVHPASPEIHVRYRWIGRVLWLSGRLAGVAMPRPIHVPLDAPGPTLRWLGEVLRSGRTPHMHTSPSTAVRLCRAATAAGVDLTGAQFSLSSEPFTEARLATIRAAGAVAVSSFASVETGRVGYGCLEPEASDDLHLAGDRFALIQPGTEGGPGQLPARALLVTALLPAARNVLLNASLGDQADLAERDCGCPMQVAGRTLHFSKIRSFEKLTAGGMTFLDSDVIRVLEELLPARFGGAPTDYQILETETADGRPDVSLLVHPRVGSVDPAAVSAAFRDALGPGNEGERLMALQWRQADLPRVERRPPIVTSGFKIHHLHQARSGSKIAP